MMSAGLRMQTDLWRDSSSQYDNLAALNVTTAPYKADPGFYAFTLSTYVLCQ
jgi:hypothetical protein